MRGHIEERYISHLDQPQHNPELKGQGFPAENVALSFFDQMGLESRYSTQGEDAGIRDNADIGPKTIIDGVVYKEKRPIISLQITTSTSPKIRQQKMAELKNHPFIRLAEMKPSDPSIPKALIYLDAKGVKDFNQNPDFSKHPEMAIQILDSALLSLGFDLTQTKNPLEQKAVQELIEMFEQEKRKYLH